MRAALEEKGEGRVLVVDAGASKRCALLGDFLAETGTKNGWSGIIINGCCRDSEEIGKLDIGVKTIGTHPLKSSKRVSLTSPHTHSLGPTHIPTHIPMLVLPQAMRRRLLRPSRQGFTFHRLTATDRQNASLTRLASLCILSPSSPPSCGPSSPASASASF